MSMEAERCLEGCSPTQSLWLSPGDWSFPHIFLCHFSISFTVSQKQNKKKKTEKVVKIFLPILSNQCHFPANPKPT